MPADITSVAKEVGRKPLMNSSRIDNLRNLVANIGAKQIEYHSFFPEFSERLGRELRLYMGDQNCVALCPAYGEFSFEQINRQAGLDIENGKYRIPLMFKLNNLNDSGHTAMRIRIFFTKNGSELSAHVDGGDPLEFDETDLAPLLEHIYQGLCSCLSEASWFERFPCDYYQDNKIGFNAAI